MKETNKPNYKRNWSWLWLAASLLTAACFFGRGALHNAAVVPTNAVAKTARQPASKAIDSIVLGDNVLTEIDDHLREKAVGDVALLPEGDRLNDKIDPQTSREVVLRAVEENGSQHEFRLIRSTAWLADSGASVGSSIHLELSEQEFAGQAEVIAIGPCPQIKTGRGRTVTGIFVHTNAQALNLFIEGQTEPLGVTPNHPIYSVDRDDFIPAGELHEGERLLRLDGTAARLVRTEHRQNLETVYNLQVQGEHVYRVTEVGLLVHNTCTVLQKDLDHIVARHWATSDASGAGKYNLGTRAAEVLRMIRQAVANGASRPNTRGRPGTIFELDFGQQIGINSSGHPASQLRVVVRPDGSVVTAFPF